MKKPTKKRAIKNKYSDGYLLNLWRKAVLIKKGKHCFLCGKPGEWDVHHFIKRSIRILRYSWINGFPLCHECHRKAHTEKGKFKLIKTMGLDLCDYLYGMEDYTLKQYFFEKQISRIEWEHEIVKEFKAIIEEETW